MQKATNNQVDHNVCVNGVVPTIITPFTQNGDIDWPGYSKLLDWYLDTGVDALFAVCQSSEMFYLSLDERVELARFTARHVSGRKPVVASGHIHEDLSKSVDELIQISETGVDAIVLVTNRLVRAADASDTDVIQSIDFLLRHLPPDMPLGLYECPAPFRLLLSDEVLSHCAKSGRFAMLKDVSCDLDTLTRRLQLVSGTPLTVLNANAAIAWPAIRAGANGFCGVFNNFHPDLYQWLITDGHKNRTLADELAVFLALAAGLEAHGYPACAKHFHVRLGTFEHTVCRVMDDDIEARYWGISQLLDYVSKGTEHFRKRISSD